MFAGVTARFPFPILDPDYVSHKSEGGRRGEKERSGRRGGRGEERREGKSMRTGEMIDMIR